MNMTRNIVLEEASNDQMNPMEMMRNLQTQMDKMQRKYEKE